MKINQPICDLCGACVSVCPGDALILHADHLELLSDKCIECLNCFKTCPVGAFIPDREE